MINRLKKIRSEVISGENKLLENLGDTIITKEMGTLKPTSQEMSLLQTASPQSPDTAGNPVDNGQVFCSRSVMAMFQFDVALAQ